MSYPTYGRIELPLIAELFFWLPDTHVWSYLDPAKSLAHLKGLPFTITHVFAGSELGVELTDEIGVALVRLTR